MLLNENKLNDIFNLPENQTEKQHEDNSPKIGYMGAGNTVIEDSTIIPTTNIDTVFNELKQLVSTGNEVLKTVKIVAESNADPELIASMASLLTAIKDTLKEFTKIYLQNIKHIQQKEIENLRIDAKKEMLQIKINEAKKLLNKNDLNNGKNIDLLPYTQESIIDAIDKINKEKQIINITPKENNV